MRILRRPSTGVAHDGVSWLRLCVAIVSFAIYAFALVGLREDRTATFRAERLSLASAISTVFYRAPLGTLYAAPLRALIQNDDSLAVPLTLPPKSDNGFETLNVVGSDGNGVGFTLLSAAGLGLFGLHGYTPTLVLLTVLALSAALFLIRFRDDRMIVIPLYFTGLTLMLFSVLGWYPQTAFDLPIGGIHYYAVVGILPAFHLALELADKDAANPPSRGWRLLLLALQTIVLVIAILTRTANAALLAAVALIGLIGLWRWRRDRPELRLQLWRGMTIALAAGGFMGLLLMLLPPGFLQEGRLTGVVWHRIFISLGFNPAFPFGDDIIKRYGCDYPETAGLTGGNPVSLKPGVLDNNGSCVVYHYVHQHNLPFAVSEPPVALYEKVLRHAFFDVAREYPREVLDTFLYYKIPMILESINQSLNIRYYAFASYRLLLQSLLILQCLVMCVFAVLSSALHRNQNQKIWMVSLLFLLSLMPGYFAAWAGPVQSVDLRLLVPFSVGAGFCDLLRRMRQNSIARRGIVPN